MADEKPWYWWAGLAGEVECEGLYRFGEFETREAAAAEATAALPDIDGNRFFYVIEAQFSELPTGGDRDPDDFQPFAASRNAEIVEVAG